MPEWVPLNFALMKHPLNWFIILVMVFLPLVAFSMVHSQHMPKSAAE